MLWGAWVLQYQFSNSQGSSYNLLALHRAARRALSTSFTPWLSRLQVSHLSLAVASPKGQVHSNLKVTGGNLCIPPEQNRPRGQCWVWYGSLGARQRVLNVQPHCVSPDFALFPA